MVGSKTPNAVSKVNQNVAKLRHQIFAPLSWTLKPNTLKKKGKKKIIHFFSIITLKVK